MTLDLNNYILAETNEALHVTTREENQAVIDRLSEQAKYSILLFSRELSPSLYDRVSFIENLKKLATSNPHAKIRIMVTEPKLIAQRGHRLLNTASRLSSYVGLRDASEQFKNFNHNIMVVDERGYFYQKNDVRYETEANFNDYQYCKSLLEQLSGIWESAKPDRDLRKMIL